jgi:hypothetical protein
MFATLSKVLKGSILAGLVLTGTVASAVEMQSASPSSVKSAALVRPAGDITGDFKVTNADLQALLEAWGTMAGDPDYIRRADFNRDGYIDNLDLQYFLEHWGAEVEAG